MADQPPKSTPETPWYAKVKRPLWESVEEIIREPELVEDAGEAFETLMDVLCKVTALELLDRYITAQERRGDKEVT